MPLHLDRRRCPGLVAVSDPDDDDPDEVFLAGSIDDVVIALTRELKKGERATIHDADCEIDQEGNGCTCEPLVVLGPGGQA